MREIIFNKEKTKEVFTLNNMPSILLDVICLNTDDSNWALRLSNSRLNFTILCYGEKDVFMGKLYSPIIPFVSPYITQPVIYYNHLLVRFDLKRLFIDTSQCKYFKLEIELSDISLNENEDYRIQFHLPTQIEYNILCQGTLNTIIYITDNHPDFISKRIVTSVPVTVTSMGYNKDLSFGKHNRKLYDKNISDINIVEDVKRQYNIDCHKNNEIVIKK